jgi:hypothetical protein
MVSMWRTALDGERGLLMEVDGKVKHWRGFQSIFGL